jgi:hypothetical protein
VQHQRMVRAAPQLTVVKHCPYLDMVTYIVRRIIVKQLH